MQKILLGLGTIAFVGAIAVSATGAFFSDTETSTGNTFAAGSIDLTVDSTQHYNNAICVEGTWQLFGNNTPAVDQYPVIGSPCDGTWTMTDLGPANKFFNFGDVKPGDQGENTVSLHINNNPAYACADLITTGNNENDLIDPESDAGDTSSSTGELAENIRFLAWLDNASTSGAVVGDNIWQVGEQQLQGSTALSSLIGATTTLTLADGALNGGAPLPGGATNYIGIFWCAGTITGGAGNLGCDGTSMGNVAQTDSATTTVSFRVVQSRNNAAFRCNPVLQENV